MLDVRFVCFRYKTFMLIVNRSCVVFVLFLAVFRSDSGETGILQLGLVLSIEFLTLTHTHMFKLLRVPHKHICKKTGDKITTIAVPQGL